MGSVIEALMELVGALAGTGEEHERNALQMVGYGLVALTIVGLAVALIASS